MRIISFNIHHCTQEKVDRILSREADIYILPELSNPQQLHIPDGFTARWTGDIDIKGLGVIWRSGLQCRVPSWFNPEQRYFLPVIAERKLIIAAWPTKRRANAPKGYPQIALEGLQEYASRFDAFPTLISGDFNLYVGQQDETEEYSLASVTALLKRYGMTSVYHFRTGEAMGKESRATYYHQFCKEQPFFLDYTFTNMPVKDYWLLSWDPSFSDHVPQLIEV